MGIRTARRVGSSVVCAFLLALQAILPFAALAEEAVVPSPTQVIDAATFVSGGDVSFAAGEHVVIDFSNVSTLVIPGNLSNSGILYALSNNPESVGISISANNISNGQGAVISTVLPAGGIPGYANAVGNLSLMLNAVQNIVNQGSITSAGSLSMTAGNSILNSIGSGAGPAPVIQAVQSVDLSGLSIVNQGLIASIAANVNAATANLTNSAAMTAGSGSVTVQNLLGSSLSIENTLGSILARDQVRFSTAAPDVSPVSALSGKGALLFSGGVIDADRIGFESPGGLISVMAERIDGAVSVSGGSARLAVREGNLQLQDMSLSGDPIIANSGGDVFLPNSLVFRGQDLAVLASGNIFQINHGSLLNIDLSAPDASSDGGDLTIVAGYDFDIDTAGAQQQFDSPTPRFTISGPSGTGGSIVLNNVSFNTSAVDGNAGNITIVAHSGTDPDVYRSSGLMSIYGQETDVTEVDATSANGNGGNVLIVAHSDNIRQAGPFGGMVGGTDESVIMPIGFHLESGKSEFELSINTSSLNGVAGSVEIYASEPVVEGGVLEFEDGSNVGTGMFAPTRTAAGQLVVPETTFQESFSQEFMAGNLRFRGQITSLGSAGNPVVSIGGRNVSVRADVLVGFDTEFRSIESGGDLYLYGQDSLRLGSGLYSAGQLNLSEDPFDQGSFWNLVDASSLVKSGGVSIAAEQLQVSPAARFLSNFGDVHFQFDRLLQNSDPELHTEILQVGLIVARGGNVHVLSAESPLRIFGTIVARAVDEAVPFRGGGIEIGVENLPAGDLAALLATQPLNLPLLASNVFRDGRDVRTEGRFVDESAGLGDFVQVYREPSSNWAALQLNGSVVANEAEFSFNNGAIILHAGSGMLNVSAAEFIVAAPLSDSAPPPPPPPPPPVLPDRPDLPAVPEEAVTLSANFNLGSADAFLAANTLLEAGQTVQIQQGVTVVLIEHTDLLTPAQYLAAMQVVSGGTQTLVLGDGGASLGTAVGGSFSISTSLAAKLAGLVIPSDVIALQDAATVGAVDFGGNLVNFGSFYLYSSSPSVEEVHLIADNLQNHHGAVISTMLPAVLPPGVVAATSELSLKVDVGAQLINSGLLSSSSNLTISAGESVVNALPAGVVAAPPAVVAFDELLVNADVVLNLGAMQSISGGVGLKVNELANLALISAAGGDVSVENISGRSLNINNSLGMLQASNQISIAVATILSTFGVQQQAPSLTVFGGTLSAQSIDFSNSAGAVGVGVDAISGVVSADAGNLSVVSGGSVLRLGELTVNGGVFLANYEGGLDLSGLFAVSGGLSSGGGEIVLLSGGSISGFGAAGQIDSLGPDSSGNITLGAGLTFQVNAAAPQEFLLDLDAACTHCLPTFAITGLGAPDGVVDLPGVSIVSGGGDLIALAAADVALGPVVSVGSNSLDSGSVRLVAGLAGVGSLLLDSINSSATGVGRAGGLVDLSAADLVFVSGIVDASSLSGSAGDVGIVSSNGSIAVNLLGASTVTAINTSAAGGAGNSAGAVRVESPQGDSLVNGIVNSSAGGQAASGQIDLAGQNVTVRAAIMTTASSGDGAAVSITAAESIILDDIISSGGTGAPAASGNGGLVAISAGLLGAGSVTTGDITTIGSGAGRAGGMVVVQAPGSVTLGNVNTSGLSGASGGNVILSMGLLPSDSPDLIHGTLITSGSPAGVVELVPVDLRALDAVDEMVRKLEALGNAIKSLSARPFLEIPFGAVRGLTGTQFSLLERYYGQQLLEILLQPDALSNFGSQIGEINLSLAELPADRSAALVDLGRLQDIQSLSRQQVALQRDIDAESSRLQTLQIRLESEFGKPFLDQDLSTTQGLLVSRSRGLSLLSTLQITMLDLQLDQLDIQLLRSPAELPDINQSRSEITDTKAQISDKSVSDQNELQLQLAHLNTFAIPLQQNLKLQSKVSEKIQQVQNRIDLQTTFQPSLWSDWNSTQELHLLIDRVGEQINLTDLQLQQVEIEQLNAPLVGANSSDLAQSRADLLSRRDGLVDSLNELRSKLSDATYGKQQLPPPPPRPEEGPRENPLIQLLSELRGQIIPDLTRRLDGNAEQLDFISNLPQVEHVFEVQLANSINGRVPFIPDEKNYQTVELPSGDERTDIGKVVNQARFMLDTSIATFNFSEKTAANGALFNLEKSKLETENGGLEFQESLLEGKILRIGDQISDLQQQQSALLDQLSQERSSLTTELSALRGQLQTLTAGSPSEGAVLTEISELREEIDIKQRLLDGIARKESVSKVEQQSKVNDLVKERTRLSGELQDVRAKLTEGEGKLQALTNNASTIDREFVESGLAYLKLVLENTETFYQVKRTDIDSRIVGLIEVPGPPQQALPSILSSSEETEGETGYEIFVHYFATSPEDLGGPGNVLVQGPAYILTFPPGSVGYPNGGEVGFDSLTVIVKRMDVYETGEGSTTYDNRYTDSQYNFSTFFDELASSLPKDLSTLPADLAAKLAELPGLAQTPKLLVPIVQEVNSDQLGQYEQSALRLGQSNLANALKDGTPVEQALAIRSVDKLVQAKALADARIQENAIALARGAAGFAQGIKDVLTSLQGTVSNAGSGQALQNDLLAAQTALLNAREGNVADDQLAVLNFQLNLIGNLLNASSGLAVLQNAGFESLRKSLSAFLSGELDAASKLFDNLNSTSTLAEAREYMLKLDDTSNYLSLRASNATQSYFQDGIQADRKVNVEKAFNSILPILSLGSPIGFNMFNIEESMNPNFVGPPDPGLASRYASALPGTSLSLDEKEWIVSNFESFVERNQEKFAAFIQNRFADQMKQQIFDQGYKVVDGEGGFYKVSGQLIDEMTGTLLSPLGYQTERQKAINAMLPSLTNLYGQVSKIEQVADSLKPGPLSAQDILAKLSQASNLANPTFKTTQEAIGGYDPQYDLMKLGVIANRKDTSLEGAGAAFWNTTLQVLAAEFGGGAWLSSARAGGAIIGFGDLLMAAGATGSIAGTGTFALEFTNDLTRGMDFNSAINHSFDAGVNAYVRGALDQTIGFGLGAAFEPLIGAASRSLGAAGGSIGQALAGSAGRSVGSLSGEALGTFLSGFGMSSAFMATSVGLQTAVTGKLDWANPNSTNATFLEGVLHGAHEGLNVHSLFGPINQIGHLAIAKIESSNLPTVGEARLDKLIAADKLNIGSLPEVRLEKYVSADRVTIGQGSPVDSTSSKTGVVHNIGGEQSISPIESLNMNQHVVEYLSNRVSERNREAGRIDDRLIDLTSERDAKGSTPELERNIADTQEALLKAEEQIRSAQIGLDVYQGNVPRFASLERPLAITEAGSASGTRISATEKFALAESMEAVKSLSDAGLGPDRLHFNQQLASSGGYDPKTGVITLREPGSVVHEKAHSFDFEQIRAKATPDELAKLDQAYSAGFDRGLEATAKEFLGSRLSDAKLSELRDTILDQPDFFGIPKTPEEITHYFLSKSELVAVAGDAAVLREQIRVTEGRQATIEELASLTQRPELKHFPELVDAMGETIGKFSEISARVRSNSEVQGSGPVAQLSGSDLARIKKDVTNSFVDNLREQVPRDVLLQQDLQVLQSELPKFIEKALQPVATLGAIEQVLGMPEFAELRANLNSYSRSGEGSYAIYSVDPNSSSFNASPKVLFVVDPARDPALRSATSEAHSYLEQKLGMSTAAISEKVASGDVTFQKLVAAELTDFVHDHFSGPLGKLHDAGDALTILNAEFVKHHDGQAVLVGEMWNSQGVCLEQSVFLQQFGRSVGLEMSVVVGVHGEAVKSPLFDPANPAIAHVWTALEAPGQEAVIFDPRHTTQLNNQPAQHIAGDIARGAVSVAQAPVASELPPVAAANQIESALSESPASPAPARADAPLTSKQQGLLVGSVEAKELIAGNTSGIQTFFAVQQSPDSGPKVVIARVANDGASVPGGESFAERVTFEQAAHQINQMLGFDSPYPAAVVREVTMPDGTSAQAMVQELAGSKSLSQYVSRPPSSKAEAKAFDVVFEQALVERLIYGDSDVHGANFMVSGRGESVKVSNIDLGRGFSQETEPRWFLPEGGVSPDSAEGQIMMFSGKSISSVTQSKVSSFVQQIKSVEGTETLKGLGLSDAQLKGVVGRAQFFAETGRFPEMESMPVPSEASAIPPVAAPDNTPFKSEVMNSDNTLVPVSFKQSVPALAAKRVDKIRLPGATLVKAPDTRMSLAAMGAIRLKSGEVCISATKASVVLDDGVRVNLAPGAIVLVGKNQNALTVSVLHDCGPGQVNVRKGSSLVSLSTGEELIFHRKRIDSESLAGHRRIVSSTMPGGEIATLSEVSIPQLLTVSPALQVMRRSNQRFERSVLEKVTKTAACVQLVTGGHGPYSAAVGK